MITYLDRMVASTGSRGMQLMTHLVVVMVVISSIVVVSEIMTSVNPLDRRGVDERES